MSTGNSTTWGRIQLAGNLVKNASFGKLKIGTARGVPTARIVVYKLVLGSLRYGFMTRAFTAAIEDKVDILNLSVGHPNDDEKIKMSSNELDPKKVKRKIVVYAINTNGMSALITGAAEEVKGAKENFPFTMASGTSMATAVVFDAAAFVKSFHLTWSSSAIKSALMTTEKSRPKAGPKRTTERVFITLTTLIPYAAWPMHQPRPKEGKGILDERMKTKMDTEVDQALHKPEEEIYQVYFDASGGDKAALPDHKKFLEDVFGSRAAELETTVNRINGHVFAISLTEEEVHLLAGRDEALGIKRWYPVELVQ
ncbi:Subtilisin-like protease SBT4.11 [Camellia lanceoleosa]|uniref:Subtilisin-like protease SBT4.11 n=1 Tax=Camellia lanceoleosa TaxID=1840588 RepID=A0ACC0G6V4_9ERIC|nr:Subtilisin-like protease SBT4.11 [Camellia lanceoleosa]